MFSLKGDTVLDPFLGTGTTTIASMATARNSIGYEIDSNFDDHISSRLSNGIVDFSNQLIENRVRNHLIFVQDRVKRKGELGYTSKVYGFPVMTSQEVEIEFNELRNAAKKEDFIEVEYSEKPSFKFIKGELFKEGKSLRDWIEQD